MLVLVIKIEGDEIYMFKGKKFYEVLKVMMLDDIKCIVEDYKKVVINVKVVGFDGVEVYVVNGYFIN